MEVRYLQEQLFKIKEEDRRYPQIEIASKTIGKKPLYDERPSILMGRPVPLKDTNSKKNVNSELKIPEFLKKRREEKGGDKNE